MAAKFCPINSLDSTDICWVCPVCRMPKDRQTRAQGGTEEKSVTEDQGPTWGALLDWNMELKLRRILTLGVSEHI